MTEKAFKAALKNANYDEGYFMKKFENRVTINEYVKENIYSPAANEAEKQQQFISWYNNARLLAEVVFYDKTLEAAVRSTSRGSSCGSNCSRQ